MSLVINPLTLLILLPVFSAFVCLITKSKNLSGFILAITAGLHLVLTLLVWVFPPDPLLGGWISLDPSGLLILSIMSLLFFCSALTALEYLKKESGKTEAEDKPPLGTGKFTASMLLFLASMTLAAVAKHLGLFWVAIEATTLASAPLISYHRNSRSLEATWKYLVLCSVGIALAFLGNLFLALAYSSSAGEGGVSLLLEDLLALKNPPNLSLFKTGFIFLIAGYGTKMGLAPLHPWLPDAHSEAPAFISCLLSGALLNGAFLGISRVYALCAATGETSFAGSILILFGLLSLLTAGTFIINQRDYKRLLAYSSIEHMGILALGLGLGGAGIYGSLYHALNHSLIKGALFLVAGNILRVYKTKNPSSVKGMAWQIPGSALLWTAGFLAITGFPPFGLFFSKIIIAKEIIEQGRGLTAVLFFLSLTIVFLGMAYTLFPMITGSPPDKPAARPKRETILSILLPGLLLAGSLLLGLYLLPPLGKAISEAALFLGGGL